MKNCLVTGVTGLIGSNLAKRLINDGYRVVGVTFDKLEYDNLEVMGIKDDLILAQGDILDEDFMTRVINGYEINHIFHLAAMSVVKTVAAMPLMALKTNVLGTGIVLEVARHAPTIHSVVAMSSDKCYGQAKDLPYVEGKTPLDGLRPYEATKSLCDQWGQMYGKNYHVPVAMVRACNVFGPGDFHLTRLVPNSIIRFLNGDAPVIWSDVKDYVREFIYVDDIVEALIKLSNMLTVEDDRLFGEGYNVGTEKIYKIVDFVNMIKDVGGFEKDIEIVQKSVAFKEIPEQYLDSSKISSHAKWNFLESFTYTNIEECLSRTINWYKELQENL